MNGFDEQTNARLQQEIEDSFDEELENELSESLAGMLADDAELAEAAARHADLLGQIAYDPDRL